MQRTLFGSALLVAMLAGQGHQVAAQQPPRPVDTLVGTDVMDSVMGLLFATYHVTGPAGGGQPGGIGETASHYLGLGSSCAERQMEGASNADEPRCGPDPFAQPDPTHPGCQEIGPMSRPMDSSICNDAESAFAEGMAVCDDTLVVLTDNASMKGDDAVACSAWQANDYAQSDNATGEDFVGTVGQLGAALILPVSGYAIGANGMEPWRDVLRVVYTGCQNDQGDCIGAIDRLVRCADPVRDELISTWDHLVAGTDCNAGGTCPGGLRRAYRRDDNSGTTGVFLNYLGVDFQLNGRLKVVTDALDCFAAPERCCDNGSRQIWSIPGDHSFCDGGHNENFAPDCQNGTFIPIGGDPLRRPCAPEDDLCDYRGEGGVVQAIRSTPGNADAFATHQCGGSSFAVTKYMISALPVCPDGSTPVGDLCFMPVYGPTGSTVGNCMAASNSNSPIVPNSTDGRAYNTVRRNAQGQVQFLSPNAPDVPSWRMNSFVADNDNLFGRFTPGFPITAAESVCTRTNATEQLGCVVANTGCTIGYAGRGGVFSSTDPTISLGNEPFKLGVGAGPAVPPRDSAIASGYPLARPLYINAIGGFENLTTDCLARGEDLAWCADQLNIANTFFHMDVGTPAHEACIYAGYSPRTAATVTCRGSADSSGCGQPNMQPKGACQPL